MRRPHRPIERLAVAGRRGAVGLVTGVVAVSLLAAGCAVIGRFSGAAETPVHAVALHRFADPGSSTCVVADAAGTQRVCINRLPLISNRQITAGRVEDTGNPDRPAIRLLLDHQGSVLWMQTCHETPGDSLAVLLDGFYWFALTVPRPLDTTSILVDGPIGRIEAEAIVKSLPKQYRQQNGKSTLF